MCEGRREQRTRVQGEAAAFRTGKKGEKLSNSQAQHPRRDVHLPFPCRIHSVVAEKQGGKTDL